MNCEDGRIYSKEQMEEMNKLMQSLCLPKEMQLGLEKRDISAFKKGHVKEMKVDPTKRQLRRTPSRVGRNEPCPCGSGKKFKWCCMV